MAHGKPYPDPFLEAARRLGVDLRRCLVVEDAPKGLEAAQAAGCFTLAVVTTTRARRWTPMPSLLTFRRSGLRWTTMGCGSAWRSSSMVPFEWPRSASPLHH